MAGGERKRVAFGELDQAIVRAAPAHQQRPGSFAESEAEFDSRYALNQRLMYILDSFDKMALAENQIDFVRLLNF